MERAMEAIVNFATTVGVKILTAVVLLILGFFVIRRLERRLSARLGKRHGAEQTLWRSLLPAGALVLKVLLVISLFGYLGVDTGSIAALVASLGVGIGLAINGALANIAGGVLILVTHPFRNGDYIGAGEEEGTVESIEMIYTKLRTPDARVIYLPNGTLSAGTVVNYSERRLRRLDMTFPIALSESVEAARAAILPILRSDERILSDPAPEVLVTDEVRSFVPLSARGWVKNEDYWDARFDLLGRIKEALDAQSIALSGGGYDVKVEEKPKPLPNGN